MYGASAHFDALNGQVESSITLFHRAETLRLLKEELARPAQVDNFMIASALTMAHMEGLGYDLHARRIHSRGLQQMVDCRGGLLSLGFNGLLRDLIIIYKRRDLKLTSSFQSGAFHSAIASKAELAPDADMDIDVLSLRSGPFSAFPPIEFLSAIQNPDLDLQHSQSVISAINRILHHVSDMCVAWMSSYQAYDKLMESKWQFVQQSFLGVPPNLDDEGSLSGLDDTVVDCCKLATLITWNAINDTTPFSRIAIDTCLRDLKSAIERTDQKFWIKHAPEAFIWICLTGAAASRDQYDRGWFTVRFGPSIMVASHAVSLMRKAWLYFRWLDQRCKERCREGEIFEEWGSGDISG
ncbi:hypothetical protein PRK78_002556 [Emydomyces testavorans]|uniref:Uncharacterized protein n=1 Tax=Emydomyces testavorans TaxID=2070801 RepID=A0AAF0DGH8_9EURO|nr:hypothetical protein PRK78_002556 [Emydomyces testavorans]